MRVERRAFLAGAGVVGAALCLPQSSEASGKSAKALEEAAPVIAAVQQHMFPKGSKLPDAETMCMTRFLTETVLHPTYDRDIRAFVIEGAKELMLREKGKLLGYNHGAMEAALRRYEATDYGSNWLSRIMILSLEALLGDPVYGSNVGEAGWRTVQSFGGQPRPKTRYIQL